MSGKLTWSQERGWWECWTCDRPAVLIERWKMTNKHMFSCFSCHLDHGGGVSDPINWLDAGDGDRAHVVR